MKKNHPSFAFCRTKSINPQTAQGSKARIVKIEDKVILHPSKVTDKKIKRLSLRHLHARGPQWS